jgi:hypothetical protein
MSFKSINKRIGDPYHIVACFRAALPLGSAVRLCLTGGSSLIELQGGCASIVETLTHHVRGKKVIAVGILGLAIFEFCGTTALSQKRRIPPGGHLAVVVDERLAALRSAPEASARLMRRLSRGRLVSIRGASRSRDGLMFYRVAATRRTSGWLQSEAVVTSWRAGDDQRLFHLMAGADEFERVARARIFLDTFPRSPWRAQVLLLYGDAAEEAAAKLSREAERRFERSEIPTDGAPAFSYYLSFSGLDRYNRQGVTFVFDRATKEFHYDGAAWRVILHRYPNSPEAAEARKRLEALTKAK